MTLPVAGLAAISETHEDRMIELETTLKPLLPGRHDGFVTIDPTTAWRKWTRPATATKAES